MRIPNAINREERRALTVNETVQKDDVCQSRHDVTHAIFHVTTEMIGWIVSPSDVLRYLRWKGSE